MKILSIETSCDETAISLLDTQKVRGGFVFNVLGNALLSQTKLHAKYGGVYPMMAKREHGKALVPLLKEVLVQAKMLKEKSGVIGKKETATIKKLLSREGDLLKEFLKAVPKIKNPNIDRIAVTSGPGLEPALWVGINFAKALSLSWDIPVIPVNHMEGHFFSSLLSKKKSANKKPEKLILEKPKFPILGLLISGGHTELVLSKKWRDYKILGATRDDAVGEAFDKVARMLGLPYPGGPQISKMAKLGSSASKYKLPRPMVNSKDFDFSFSGLKTAVLYLIKKIGKLSTGQKQDIAKEFEDSVTEVLVTKTLRAVKEYKIKTLLIGGGVSSNEKIRHEFTRQVETKFPDVKLYLPEQVLTTDNAIMVAVAGYFHKGRAAKSSSGIKANGNLSF
ncbi:MAG: tRNA (adenosine(37)-N6)-threonylcarbamoyltransferase complex transferase subunit TsaD [Patescibacteria group bacterium]